jgi:metal-sulfur cluster biosynthetic enzyme
MQIATSNSPKASVVLPHYAFAAVAFFVATILLFFSKDALIGHYFHPKLLAVTHLTVLGWAVMIIFGALYQLLPVVLKVSLYSELHGRITFILLASGTILLSTAFWIFEVGLLMQIGGSLVFLSFLCFNINIFLTARKSTDWEIATDFISTSCIWLFFTGLVGVLMVFNFQFPFLKDSHLEYLKLHAHLGIVGWFLLLIIGVASKLFPMFLMVHEVNQKLLSVAYYLINGGLIGFVIQQFFFKNIGLIILVIVCIGTGIGCFAFYCAEVYYKRIRKDLDKAMKQTCLALILLLAPLLFLVVINSLIYVDEKFYLQLILGYGFSIFFGFITAIILGQTFKTLPFIVWMHKYQRLVGKQKTPLPKDLYSEKFLLWQNASYLAGFVIVVIGIVTMTLQLLQIGGVFLILASVFYLVNVYKIFLHLIPHKLKPMEENKIYELLKQIIDPELGINIVDLGLVYKVLYRQGESIDVEMTLTTKGCPMGEAIINGVGEILQENYPDYRVKVYLTWEPKWTSEMISEEGMALL